MRLGKTQITDQDRLRLSSLLELDTLTPTCVESLRRKLENSAPVATTSVPSDLVTMNSVIRGVIGSDKPSDPQSVRVITLAYPHAASERDGSISILTPLGVELLGARVGDTVKWSENSGQQNEMIIEGVLFQPEASGDWHL